MATTFNVFYLGTFATIDPDEGDEFAEDASVLVGETIGGPGSPLYESIQEFSPGSAWYGGGLPSYYDPNNVASNDQFRIDGGADQTFDAAADYTVTSTCTDGTTALTERKVLYHVAQNVYLLPDLTNTADQDALEAKPIESCWSDSVDSSARTCLNTHHFSAGDLVPTAKTMETAAKLALFGLPLARPSSAKSR